jgi:hypothetical protein
MNEIGEFKELVYMLKYAHEHAENEIGVGAVFHRFVVCFDMLRNITLSLLEHHSIETDTIREGFISAIHAELLPEDMFPMQMLDDWEIIRGGKAEEQGAELFERIGGIYIKALGGIAEVLDDEWGEEQEEDLP